MTVSQQFLNNQHVSGSVTLDVQAGFLQVWKKKMQLTRPQARLLAVFMANEANGNKPFSAKTGAEMLGFSSAEYFKGQVIRARRQLDHFVIANYGGLDEEFPYTVYASSLLLSGDFKVGENQGYQEVEDYTFNTMLAESITRKHQVSHELMRKTRIQTHPQDPRFFTGMAVFGHAPNTMIPKRDIN